MMVESKPPKVTTYDMLHNTKANHDAMMWAIQQMEKQQKETIRKAKEDDAKAETR